MGVTGDKRQELRDRRRQTGDIKIFEIYSSVMHFFDGTNFLPKMWRSGAKIEWCGAAVALMRSDENFSRKNGEVVRWRKDLKGGARRSAAN